jgi:hypothetical protein
MKLKVIKPLSWPRGTYKTRHMVPGDTFDAEYRTKKDILTVKLLLKSGKVQAVRESVPVAAPPPAVAEKIAETFGSDELKALRDEYEAKLGKKPFWGWSADRLREMIASAKPAP